MTDEPNQLKVVAMSPKKREVNEELVKAVRDVLDQAERGDVVGLCVAWLDHDRRVYYLKGGVHSFGTIGAMGIMHMQLMRALE